MTLEHGLLALSDYTLANSAHTYHLDGQQQSFTLLLTSQRIINLSSYLIEAFPLPARALYYIGVATTTSSLTQLLFPIIKIVPPLLIAPNTRIRNFILLKTPALIDRVNGQLNKIGDLISPLATTAITTSYVALIALGHPIYGAMGLASMLVLAAKRFQLVPAQLDRLLTLTSNLTSIITSIIAPYSLILKIPTALYLVTTIIDYCIHFKPFEYLLLKLLKDHPPHEIPDPNAIDITSFSERNILFSSLRFEPNRFSFLAPEVSQILSTDTEEDLSQITIEEMYKLIEEKIERLQIQCTKNEKKGWKTLKTGVLSQRVADTLPPNFKHLSLYLKATLHSQIKNQDANSFEQVVRELAQVGNQCVEGWNRNIGFLLHPTSKNYKWTIHHYHAIFRSELLKESMRELFGTTKARLLDPWGGTDNVHVANQIQAVLECRWHSYEAKVFFSIHGRSLLQQIMKKFLQKPIPQDIFFSTNKIVDLLLCNSIETLNIPPSLYTFVDRKMEGKYCSEQLPETLSDVIYEKIKPQYRDSSQKGRYELFRDIEWETISSWFPEIQKKGFEIIDSKGTYNPKWIETDLTGSHYLTKNGVILLLWDLGILTAKQHHFRGVFV